jgi:hypothetical protein
VTFEQVQGQPWSTLHRAGDQTVGMILVDHERRLPTAGRGRGTLLAIPASDLLAVCPVDRRENMQSRALEFARWVAKAYGDAEDPCTAGVFWLTGELLAELPVDLDRSPAVALPKALKTPAWRRWLNR